MRYRAMAALLVAYAALVASGPQASAHPQADPSRERTTSIHLYYVAINAAHGSRATVGCGDLIVPVTRRIAPTTTPLRTALRLLIADHDRYFGRSGLYNALAPARLHLQRLTFANGHATVRLGGRLNQAGECDAPRIRAQLRRTVLQFGTVHSVSFWIGGIPLRKLLSGKG